jgi:uncharacterized protein YabN with tetrapyrrole methylase and pyrophosphatase domain
VQKKAVTIGLDLDADPSPALDRLDDDAFAAQLGDLLYAVVARARRLGVDPEDALRASATRQRDRLRSLERSDFEGDAGPAAAGDLDLDRP